MTPSQDELLEMYRRMYRIRVFEERARKLYRATEVPGFLHLSIGQEASAVGACWPLRSDDVIISNHRGHGHCIAKGLDPESMFAELMGREGGSCGGRGGSMHIADPRIGIFGANGIVGAGMPIAVGAATAARLRGSGTVTVAFFGDGAVAQGAWHEAVNLASVWELPVVFFCENNHYAEFSQSGSQGRGTMADRAAGYGIDYAPVDGNDVLGVAEIMGSSVARMRETPRPVLIEAETYRWAGHYEGDPQRYRTEDEVNTWMHRDPLTSLRRHVADTGTDVDKLDAIEVEERERLDEAVDAARRSSEPSSDTLYAHVTQPSPAASGPSQRLSTPVEAGGDVFRTMDAIRLALQYELATDPSVFLAGIDVGAGGNVFGVTRGLHDEFPGRILDTPISETALVGTAVGAAMAGMRPVVEVMYMDFLGVCFDQLMNQAAKLRYMTGGRASVPLVVRTQFGAGRSSGSQHSQSLEALLAHIPGLTVVMPSTPADTYGLLRAAIRDPNPVVFVEHRGQYGRKGPRPTAESIVPLGSAVVTRRGCDVTLVSWSRMVQESMRAADTLADEGISVEVIDLRTIVPLDRETVLTSLSKTNRMVVAHEAVRDFGVGAGLAALAVDEGFWDLDAPVARVGAPYTPSPYAPSLEAAWLPAASKIVEAVRRVAAA